MPTNDGQWNDGQWDGQQADTQPGNQQQEQSMENGTTQNPGQRVQQISENAHRVVDDSRSLISDGLQAVTDRMNTNPYQTMLIAAGVGYVLGGGLFTSLTVRMLRTGLRMAAMPVVRNELVNLASSMGRS